MKTQVERQSSSEESTAREAALTGQSGRNDDGGANLRLQEDSGLLTQQVRQQQDRINDLEDKNHELQTTNRKLLEKIEEQQIKLEAYERKLSELPAMIESILEQNDKCQMPSSNGDISGFREMPPQSSSAAPTDFEKSGRHEDTRNHTADGVHSESLPTSLPRNSLESSRGSSFSELRSSIVSNNTKAFFASDIKVRECIPRDGIQDDEQGDENKANAKKTYFWSGWRKGSGSSHSRNRGTIGNEKANTATRIGSVTSTTTNASGGSLVTATSKASSVDTNSANTRSRNQAQGPSNLRSSTNIADAAAMVSMEDISASFSLESVNSDISGGPTVVTHAGGHIGNGDIDSSQDPHHHRHDLQNNQRRQQTMLDLVM